MNKFSRVFLQKICKSVNKSKSHCAAKVEPKIKDDSRHAITRLRADDHDKCLDLMWRTFFIHEPTSKSLCVTRNALLDDLMCASFALGHTFVARRQKDDEIVGACVNDFACSWTADELDKLACSTKIANVRAMLKFWAFMERGPDIEYSPKVFELGYLFVDESERGKGLATELVKRSLESGADCGFPLMRIDATATASARIAEKLGMKLIYEIPYCNYIGQDDRPVIRAGDDEISVKVYVMRPSEMKFGTK